MPPSDMPKRGWAPTKQGKGATCWMANPTPCLILTHPFPEGQVLAKSNYAAELLTRSLCHAWMLETEENPQFLTATPHRPQGRGTGQQQICHICSNGAIEVSYLSLVCLLVITSSLGVPVNLECISGCNTLCNNKDLCSYLRMGSEALETWPEVQATASLF